MWDLLKYFCAMRFSWHIFRKVYTSILLWEFSPKHRKNIFTCNSVFHFYGRELWNISIRTGVSVLQSSWKVIFHPVNSPAQSGDGRRRNRASEQISCYTNTALLFIGFVINGFGRIFIKLKYFGYRGYTIMFPLSVFVF